jgi:hypothetical protein
MGSSPSTDRTAALVSQREHTTRLDFPINQTIKLTRSNSAARFDKVILIYDSLFILSKSSTLNLHVDISASILKLVSVHPNFVSWVVLDWWMEIQ